MSTHRHHSASHRHAVPASYLQVHKTCRITVQQVTCQPFWRSDVPSFVLLQMLMSWRAGMDTCNQAPQLDCPCSCWKVGYINQCSTMAPKPGLSGRVFTCIDMFCTLRQVCRQPGLASMLWGWPPLRMKQAADHQFLLTLHSVPGTVRLLLPCLQVLCCFLVVSCRCC